MKQKTITYKSGLLGKRVVMTPDDNLNKLKGKALAPRKLEDANKILKNVKGSIPQ